MYKTVLSIILILAFVNCKETPCCPFKKVGGIKYIFKKTGDHLDLSHNGCKSPCIYSPENDDSKEFCFGQGSMESECLADVYPSLIPLSYCCHIRTVKGQEYRRVKLYEGEIPENCRDSCIYTKNSNATISSEKYFCFTKRDNLVAIPTCEDLDQIESEFGDLNRLQKTTRQQLQLTPIQGCPSYEHLQSEPDKEGKCAYLWTGNMYEGTGNIFGFNACKGDYLFMENNTQWDVEMDGCTFVGGSEGLYKCGDLKWIQDIIVAPGCNLIFYGQPGFFYQDFTTPLPKYNYIDLIQGPNTIHEYNKIVQSMVCSCSPVSEPKDDWEVILECDNRHGIADTTCNYARTVGTSYKYTNGTGGNQASSSDSSSTVGGSASLSASATASASAGAFGVSAKVSATVKTSISASFSKKVGKSHITGIEWSSVASNSFEESVSISLSETVPPGKCLQVKQAVGYLGQAVVRTNVYQMISC